MSGHQHHEAAGANGSWTGSLIMVVLMAALMALTMAPLLAAVWRLVATRNFESHRGRALGSFTVGYLSFWFVFSVALGGAVHALGVRGSVPVFAAVCALATAWQMSSRRLMLSRRCGRIRTAPPRGRALIVGHVESGWFYARACGRVCWASMVVMAVAPTMWAMLLVSAMTLLEYRPGRNPFAAVRRVTPAIALGLLGAASAAFAIG